MTTKNRKPTREHKSGKSTGYDIEGEAYYLAPTYLERFLELAQRRQALEQLLKTVLAFVEDGYRHLSSANGKLFSTISEDLGIDTTTMIYELSTNTMRPKPKPGAQP